MDCSSTTLLFGHLSPSQCFQGTSSLLCFIGYYQAHDCSFEIVDSCLNFDGIQNVGMCCYSDSVLAQVIVYSIT